MREGSKPVGVNHMAVRKLSRSFAPRVTTRAGMRIPKGLLPWLPASNISGSVQSIAVSVFQAHELSRILIGRYEDRKRDPLLISPWSRGRNRKGSSPSIVMHPLAPDDESARVYGGGNSDRRRKTRERMLAVLPIRQW